MRLTDRVTRAAILKSFSRIVCRDNGGHHCHSVGTSCDNGCSVLLIDAANADQGNSDQLADLPYPFETKRRCGICFCGGGEDGGNPDIVGALLGGPAFGAVIRFSSYASMFLSAAAWMLVGGLIYARWDLANPAERLSEPRRRLGGTSMIPGESAALPPNGDSSGA